MSKPFYITTAIDYTNAAPHIGHAYEKVLADALARYHRACGEEVFFLTGVDQHGQKVQQAAARLGISPADFTRQITEGFLYLWNRLGISNDRWAATTDPLHHHCVRTILDRLHDAGQLYKAPHTGYFSVRQEQFLTDKERNADGEFGPEWGEVVFLEEENWYFRLADHREWLLEFLGSRPGVVLPAFRQVELINAAAKISGDLCISRPKSRLSWGIEFPFAPDFVTYVWFDALINYISFAGYHSEDPAEQARFDRLWPSDAQVIGKDILVPAHGIYWLCMLHAMGFPDDKIPTLLVHGWWNLDGGKMSKSLGNIVDPVDLADRYGVTALRYYLLRDISTGQDADFNSGRLESLYNSELANGLGNLLNRALNMTRRYCEGCLRPLPTEADRDPRTSALLSTLSDSWSAYHEAMRAHDVQGGLGVIQRAVQEANTYAEQMAPWKLAKDPTQAALVAETLTTLCLAARQAAAQLEPVTPDASSAILAQLRLPRAFSFAEILDFPDNHQVGDPVPVFPRLEPPSETNSPASPA